MNRVLVEMRMSNKPYHELTDYAECDQALFEEGLRAARSLRSLEAIEQHLMAVNEQFAAPLPEWVVEKIAMRVWEYRIEGRLYSAEDPGMFVSRAEHDELRAHPHAYVLFLDLLSNHGSRRNLGFDDEFILANAMAKKRLRWTLPTFRKAIATLEHFEIIEVVNAGGGKGHGDVRTARWIGKW